MKAIILIGCSGSGKSTLAEQMICSSDDWVQIERDDYRECILMNKFPNIYWEHENIWSGKWNWKWESEVNAMVAAAISGAHAHKENIVISDTNLNINSRKVLKLKLEELGYIVEEQVVGKELTLPELWKQDLNRKNSVGHEIIAKQYEQFRKEFPLQVLKDVSDKQLAVIFDIDGTIAEMVDRGPFDWDKVGQDKPNDLLFYSIDAFYNAGFEIIFMSGRDSVCREETSNWISDNLLNRFEYKLFMRPEKDMRKDVEIKKELFFNHVDGNYKVAGVFDDRPAVCHLWRELGFRVYACANPYLNF